MLISPVGRTEGYDILFGRTVYQWCWCIKSITIVRGTSSLKHFGVDAWFALLWGPILIPATEHVQIESQASTLAGHYFHIVAQDLKLLWAQAVHICQAASNGTFWCPRLCCDRNREIVAINQAYIIKAWLALVWLQRNLNQCSWGKAYSSIACKATITVTSLAGWLPIGVEFAASSGPKPATPCWWGIDASGLAWRKAEATIRYHWMACVWGSCRPYWKGAFVAYIQGNRLCCCIFCEIIFSQIGRADISSKASFKFYYNIKTNSFQFLWEATKS